MIGLWENQDNLQSFVGPATAALHGYTNLAIICEVAEVPENIKLRHVSSLLKEVGRTFPYKLCSMYMS